MPYGELITTLDANLSKLEAKLAKAEKLLKDFNTKATQLGNIKVGGSGSGAGGGGGTGGMSQQTRDHQRHQAFLTNRQRAADAEESRQRRANLNMGSDRLREEDRQRRARLSMNADRLREESNQRRANSEMNRDRQRRQNEVIRNRRQEDVLHRRAEGEMRRDQTRQASRINIARDREESTQRRANFEMGRGRLGEETQFRRAQIEMSKGRLGEEGLHRRASIDMDRDFAKREEATAKRVARAHSDALKTVHKNIRDHGIHQWNKMKGSIGDVIDKVKFFGSVAVIGGLTAWVKHGIEMNSQYQRFALTLETVLDLTSKVTEKATGRELKGAEKNAAISQKAKSLFKTVRKVAGPLPLTEQELFQVLSENLGTAMNSGGKLGSAKDDEKLVTVFAHIAQLAKNMGLPGGQRQLSQEIRAIFEGERSQSASVMKTLGLNVDDIKKFKQEGTLLDELIKRLKAGIDRTSDSSQRLDSAVSMLKSKFDEFSRQAFAEAFQKIVKAIQRLNESLSDAKIQANARKIGEAIAKIAEAVIDFMESPWPGKMADWIQTIASYWKPLVAVGLAFKSIGVALALFAKGKELKEFVDAVKLVTGVTAKKAAAEAAGSGVGGVVGGAAGGGFLARAGALLKGGAGVARGVATGVVGSVALPLSLAIAGGMTVSAHGQAVGAEQQAFRAQQGLSQLRAKNPVQRKLDSLAGRREMLIDQAMRLREIPNPPVGIKEQIQGISGKIQDIDSQSGVLRAKLPVSSGGGASAPVDAEFTGKKDFRAEQQGKFKREVAMLRALQQQFAPDEMTQLRGDAARDVLKLEKQFKFPTVRAQAVKARKNKLRMDAEALRQEQQASRLETGGEFLEATGNKAEGLIAGARANALRDASAVNRGQLKPDIARVREMTAFARVNKELVEGRRDAVNKARDLMDDMAKATQDSSKRQRDFQNQLYEFERQTVEKRKGLIKDQKDAQRGLNDAIRDQVRAIQDVANSRTQRSVRKEFTNFAKSETASHQSLFHDSGGNLIGGSNTTGTIEGLLFNKEMSRLSVDQRNEPERQDEAKLKVKRQIKEWSDKLASPGGVEDVLTEIKGQGIDLTRKQRSQIRKLGVKAEQSADLADDQKEAREVNDEQRKITDAEKNRVDAKDKLTDANKALKDFPAEVAKTIVELRENFNQGVRDAGAQMRNLAEAARAAVEDIKAMGGGKSPLAGQISAIQKSAAAQGAARPKFFDERFGDVAGKVSESSTTQQAGGIQVHVNFKMSPDTEALGKEFGKKLERDARRYAPRK